MNNELAENIFNALYDDEDLDELYQRGMIKQKIGFKLSSIAAIESEIDDFFYSDGEE